MKPRVVMGIARKNIKKGTLCTVIIDANGNCFIEPVVTGPKVAEFYKQSIKEGKDE